MWFDKNHLYKHKKIKINDLNGYVLPHAGTKYTGKILSHTLRFRPKKQFNKFIIVYYPANSKPNVKTKGNNYYHEYYVILKTLQFFFPNKEIYGFNASTDNLPEFNTKDTLIVLSVDFSHFLPLQKAIKIENCAAHSLMFKKYDLNCIQHVDHIKSFNVLNKLLKQTDYNLHWVGRTRSPGLKGVGYLSFLIRKNTDFKLLQNIKKKPNGFFVTAYDKNMTARECLGNTKKWTIELERNLISNVIFKAQKYSRLTNGAELNIPVKYYSVTYLFKEKTKTFIRGWHSIMKNAFYLSNVFLENTFDNGMWIKSNDHKWKNGNIFNMNNTFDKLKNKAKTFRNKQYNKKYNKKTKKEKIIIYFQMHFYLKK